MALEKVTVPLNLTEGIDTKTDDKLSMKPSEMENMTHQGKGTPKKRNGKTSLSKAIKGGGTITSGKYAFGYKDQALMVDENYIYRFIESSQEWERIAPISLSTLSAEFIANIGVNSTLAGMAKTSTVTAYVTSGASTIGEVFLIDSETGIPLSEPVGGSLAGQDTRLVAVGEEIISVYWSGGVSTNLIFRNLTSNIITTPITNTTGRFDVTTDGTFVYIVYNTTTNIEVYKMNTDGTVAASQSFAIPAPSTIHTGSNPCIEYNNNEVHIVYVSTNGGREYRYLSIDTSLAVVVTDRQIDFLTNINANLLSGIVIADTFSNGLPSGSSIFILYNDRDSGKSGSYELSLSSYLSVGTTERDGVEIASQPFNYAGKAFALFKMEGDQNINWVILDWLFNPQAMVNSFDTTEMNLFVNNSLNDISPDFEIAYIDDSLYLKKCTIDFSYKQAGDFVEFGKNTFLPGSLPLRYNGTFISEVQFLSRPQVTGIGHAPGPIPADTYDYIAIYEYREANGNIVRSEPSQQVQFNSTGGTLSISVKSLKVSMLDDADITVRLYRKQASELVFKLVDESVVNNRNVDVVVIPDATSPANLADNEALYTTGDILANETMPAISHFGFSNNRLFGVRSEDLNQLLPSKKYVIGEGMQFSNFLNLNAEDNQNRRADKLIASIGMDNKLIVFKRNTVLAIFGDGPDATGANGLFSEPELVTTDVGCTNPRSIVATGDGIYFQSQKGIFLLTRKLETVYKGAPAEGFNGLDISGAVLMEDINQIRWTTFDGVTIVYDYYYDQWKTFSNYQALACFIHKGKMTILQSDGSLQSENDNFDDDGSFIKQKLTTGWLKIGGPQEFQRVYRLYILGEWKSKHTLKVNVYYDYRTYPEQTFEIDATSSDFELAYKPDQSDVETGDVIGPYQFNLHLERQKCQAVKVSIEDAQVGSIVGESFQLTDFSFLVGKKRGMFKTAEGVQY